MRKKIVISIILIVLIISALFLEKTKKVNENDENQFKIVTSFYPMYIIALNITDGAENIKLENMADVSVGCLHEYTLVTKDLVKLENADVFIQNGLGVELFMDKVISNYPNINIIDSSVNVQDENIMHEDDEENGHIWLNIDNYITQVQTISEGLCTLDSKNVDIYRKNTDEYIKKLEKLKEKYDSFEFTNKTVISFNEAFEYLLDYLNIETIEIKTEGEESTMSAKTLSEIIDKANEENITTILLDKNDNTRDAKIIENETNCTIQNLNSGLYGNFEKDAYINQMHENLQKLQALLNK
mgnify:FL=1